MFRSARQLHFVGIGGSGMSGIAEVLVTMGYGVSGSDQAVNPSTRRLQQLGAEVHTGHRGRNVHGADVVVTSSAVGEDNPEVIEARRLSIPVIPRAEMLAELMRMKHAVLIAGAHGKTSTTAMIAEMLGRSGLDPTVVIGGRLGRRSGAQLGNGELMVAEADESDGSFLKMKPTIAVVTNIDREHLDHYADLEAIRRAFSRFLSRIPFYGTAVVCADDPHVREILPEIDRKLITFGIGEQAHVRATDVKLSRFESTCRVSWNGRLLGQLRLRVPGRHSVQNALAAVAVGLELELTFPAIAQGLAAFEGADRRFQCKGEAHGALVIDDYGHHPTEIRATLDTVHEGFGRRAVVVFQPHRYSRTQHLLDEFARAFDRADQVIVTEIYAAGETPLPGIDGGAVARAIKQHGHSGVIHATGSTEIVQRLRECVRHDDVVVTFGAGDVWKYGEEFIRSDLRQRADVRRPNVGPASAARGGRR